MMSPLVVAVLTVGIVLTWPALAQVVLLNQLYPRMGLPVWIWFYAFGLVPFVAGLTMWLGQRIFAKYSGVLLVVGIFGAILTASGIVILAELSHGRSIAAAIGASARMQIFAGPIVGAVGGLFAVDLAGSLKLVRGSNLAAGGRGIGIVLVLVALHAVFAAFCTYQFRWRI